MSFKTIVVYLPGPDMADVLLKTAIPVATRYDAHLICLHVIPELEFFQPVGMYIDGGFIEAQRKSLRKEANEIEEVVKKWSEPDNSRIEWRCLTATNGQAIDYIIDQSFYADLVIAEQRPAMDALDSRADLPVQISLQGGRPVLAVPEGCTFDGVADRAMVAWNPGKSSSRALFESIPLLRNAKDVTLHTVNPPKVEDGLPPAQNMALSLSRHDIHAETTTGTTGRQTVGEAILDQAAQLDSDLLVMGCYGHSRYREIVFGGVTKHVLHNTKIPLFLAH